MLRSAGLLALCLTLCQAQVRMDCHPEPGASAANCADRGCIWKPADNTADPVEPWCYLPTGIGYTFDSQSAGTTYLVKNNGPKSPWGNEAKQITFKSTTLGATLNLKIGASGTYSPPIDLFGHNSVSSDSLTLETSTMSDPFYFKIKRKSTGRTLFDTSIGGMIIADQFIQLATYLPSDRMYGWGENIHQQLKHDFTKYLTWGMFARDEPPNSGSLDTKNLYGTLPFYIMLEPDGKAHGVIIINSNAQEVTTAPGPALIYRTIGGNLDLYFFPGPTPENVIQQYEELVGRPFLPAYWSLGFQISRYGYKNLDEMKQKIQRNIDAGIPLDVAVSDIDYMDRYKDFTVGSSWTGFGDYVRQLKSNGMHLIPIFDPAIQADYPSFQRALDSGGKFIEWERMDQVQHSIQDLYPMAKDTKIMLGVVWPDRHVGFPDFLDSTNATLKWWINEFVTWQKDVPFDGIWIDMNEPSNFGTNEDHPWYFDSDDHPDDETLKCPMSTSAADSSWDVPPYQTHAVYNYGNGAYLATKTLCMNAIQDGGKQRFFNVKNLYGLTEAKATQQALFAATGKRGAVVSRSTFPSAGRYTGHWLGDNTARWEDYRTSIIGAQEFNIFGMPYVGSDVCGFIGETNEELCLRWQQMGAFHSFFRNHNDIASPPQDPAQWPSVAAATKKANLFRYQYLPYLFSLHFIASRDGGTVVRPLFFEFPLDAETHNLGYQFMWGSAILVAPVTGPGQTSVDAYLPTARWYGLFDAQYGQIVDMGFQNLAAPTTSNAPCLVRGGYIVPRQTPSVTTAATRQNPFQLLVAPDDTDAASGELYWDDGESIVDSFDTYQYYHWNFTYAGKANQKTLTVTSTLQGGITIPTLDMIEVFNHIGSPDFTSFKLNGAKVNIDVQKSSYSALTQILVINTKNLLDISGKTAMTLTWSVTASDRALNDINARFG